MIYKKLHAFTLLEMIVVMIIGAIVIALIFGIFLNVQTSWNIFHKTQDKITSLLLFKTAFEQDINNAETIRTNDSRSFYICSSDLKDTIQYTFPEFIVRRYKTHSDTFFVKVNNVVPTYTRSLEKLGVVSEISMDVHDIPDVLHITFRTSYVSSNLLKLTLNQ